MPQHMGMRWGRRVLMTFTALFLLSLYAPFVLMLTLSFTGPSGGPTLPMRGFSAYWYLQLFDLVRAGGIGSSVEYTADVGTQMGSVGAPLLRSLTVSLLTMLVSTTLGLMTALGFRRPFRWATPVFYVILMAAVLPGLTLGLGVLLFAQNFGVDPTWHTTGLATQIVWTYPFAFVIMLITIKRFDQRFEEASQVLGAGPWRTFWSITLPLLSPGLLTAALFTFTLSFDEYSRSFFVVGSEQTLPVLILASTTSRLTPKLYALGALTTVVSVSVIGTYLLLTRTFSRRVRRGATLTSGAPVEVA